MLRVEEALDQILRAVKPLPPIETSIDAAPGRFLAEDIFADIDLPPFDNSAVDGYAVKWEDTVGASAGFPVILREIGDISAGDSPQVAATSGSACRIMTGAPMPAGADAVVMVEDTKRIFGDPGDTARVAILEEAVPEQHIRRAGEDLRKGACVLRSGARIRPAELAMLATMGRATFQVVRSPRVAVFSTGDELVDIGSGGAPPPGKIRDSNRWTIAAMVREIGCLTHIVRHLPDDPAATEAALLEASTGENKADVIVTAGGVSVGDRDYVKSAVDKLGGLDLWRVAIKPGKPVAFGRVGDALFFGLPGNPISAMVTFELFARPALIKMSGGTGAQLQRRTVSATLTEAVPHAAGRREYVRAITEWERGEFVTRPSGLQGSAMLLSATLANSFLVVPEDAADVAAGARVEVVLLD